MAKNKTVSFDQFAKAITETLEEYRDVVVGDVQAAVDRVAKESVKELKSNIADKGLKRTGAYQKSWVQGKFSGDDSAAYSRIIYSKDRAWLAHLLEHGHLTRTGKRQKVAPHKVEGVEHIAPVDAAAAEKLERYIMESLKGG